MDTYAHTCMIIFLWVFCSLGLEHMFLFLFLFFKCSCTSFLLCNRLAQPKRVEKNMNLLYDIFHGSGVQHSLTVLSAEDVTWGQLLLYSHMKPRAFPNSSRMFAEFSSCYCRIRSCLLLLLIGTPLGPSQPLSASVPPIPALWSPPQHGGFSFKASKSVSAALKLWFPVSLASGAS